MNKHILLLFAMVCMSLHTSAFGLHRDSVGITEDKKSCASYQYNKVEASDWGANWFVGGQVGVSALVGTPKGCADIFDRLKPSVNLYAGKWIKPSVGVRLSAQGWKTKNAALDTHNYISLHADLMYNVASLFHSYDGELPRWDVIPYIGTGISYTGIKPGEICACNTGKYINHPFTIAYGVQVRYRMTNRLYATGEFAGLTTYQSFDGYGSASKLGDNIFALNIGLAYTIGRNGWEHFSDCTQEYENTDISRMRVYKVEDTDGEAGKGYSLNDYSGLNSLRARLKGAAVASSECSERIDTTSIIEVPIFFFFKKNTDELVDDNQRINIDEVAKAVNEYDLKISITGAADSATGTVEINKKLSRMRGKMIAEEFRKRGVEADRISIVNWGGIDKYDPDSANRFSKVIISK